MGLSHCPVAIVAAPVDCVWDLLSEPAHYDEWWDAHMERIVPAGTAAPGQMLHGKTPAFGRQWSVTLRVERVNPDQHQIQLYVMLPLGVVNHATITATAIDAVTSRVQFG
jgi:hypothetical protein